MKLCQPVLRHSRETLGIFSQQKHQMKLLWFVRVFSTKFHQKKIFWKNCWHDHNLFEKCLISEHSFGLMQYCSLPRKRQTSTLKCINFLNISVTHSDGLKSSFYVCGCVRRPACYPGAFSNLHVRSSWHNFFLKNPLHVDPSQQTSGTNSYFIS